jgi:hypothetical protein
MSENPVAKLGRLLGGVVLMNGRLGHQVLGQLLVLGASEVELAGANVVIAATTRQRNAVAQVAVRTAVPALAAHGILSRQEKRLERLATLIDERERTLDTGRQALKTAREGLESERHAARAHSREVDQRLAEARLRIAALEEENRGLQAERAELRAHLEEVAPAAAPIPTPPPLPPRRPRPRSKP